METLFYDFQLLHFIKKRLYILLFLVEVQRGIVQKGMAQRGSAKADNPNAPKKLHFIGQKDLGIVKILESFKTFWKCLMKGIQELRSRWNAIL